MVLRQNSHLAEISESQLAGLVHQYKQDNGISDDIETHNADTNGVKASKKYTGEYV